MRRMNVVNRKNALKVVKELDAFPKVAESYKESTPSGGGVSILVFFLIGVLIFSEIQYYNETELKYSYEVDAAFNEKLQINIDMTIAMKCDHLGADVLDSTGHNVDISGSLTEEPFHYQLSKNHQRHVDQLRQISQYIREEYHAIHEFLWRSGYSTSNLVSMPPREDVPKGEPDGCRLHGTVTVKKLAGNFHITAGKSLNIAGMHGHMQGNVFPEDYNFSHRINQFSYGEMVPGIVNPMDGEEKLTDDNYQMYQYFIKVVPTRVSTKHANVDTYQYAVTERNRSIDHSKGSHGVPGIFIKYDMSALKFTVREETKSYMKFLVRLSGIIGGVFATSGLLHSLSGFFIDLFCSKYKLGKYKRFQFTTSFESIPSQPVPVSEFTPMAATAPDHHPQPSPPPSPSQDSPSNLLSSN